VSNLSCPPRASGYLRRNAVTSSVLAPSVPAQLAVPLGVVQVLQKQPVLSRREEDDAGRSRARDEDLSRSMWQVAKVRGDEGE
jgi:hypothetical protein